MNEEKKQIDVYLERKELVEQKEREFLGKIEEATRLLKSLDFDGAVKIYVSSLSIADEMHWPDKKHKLKDLIFDAREREKRHHVETRQRLEQAGKEYHERGTMQKALDLMHDASQKYQDGNYTGAISVYKECIAEFGKIDACHEIEMIEDSIAKIDAEITEIARQKKMKAQIEAQDAEFYKQREQELHANQKRFERELEQELQKVKDQEKGRVVVKEILQQAVAVLHEANEKFREARNEKHLNEQGVNVSLDGVIERFTAARTMFEEANWQGELAYIKESIALVNKERERKLAAVRFHVENETRMADRAKFFSMPVMAVHKEKEDLEAKARALDEKRQAKQSRQGKAFALLDVANRELDTFERGGKIIGDSFRDNEYPRIVASYLAAMDEFTTLGGSWSAEMEKIRLSIGEIRKKEATFLAEKEAFERERREREDRAAREQASWERRREQAKQKDHERSTRIQERARTEREDRQRLQDEIDTIMNAALYHFKKHDLDKSRECYEQALEWLQARGWEREATAVSQTIDMIRERKEMLRKRLVLHDTLDQDIETAASLVHARELEPSGMSDEERAAIMERQAKARQQQDAFYATLNEGLGMMREKRFLEAVPVLEAALKVAVQFNWRSQVDDLRDYIRQAREEHARIEAAAAVREQRLKDQEALAARIRGPVEVVRECAVDVEAVAKREREAILSNEAYQHIDRARALAKSERKQDAIDAYTKAVDAFTCIGWSREADLVKESLTVLERQVAAERQMAERRAIEQRASEAYTLMNSAEVHVQRKQYQAALDLFARAASIFEEIGYTSEREMIDVQVNSTRDAMERLSKFAEGSEAQALVDKATSLADSARELAGKNQIFKAWEAISEAKSLLERAGDAGARQLEWLAPLVEELEREKAKKEQILKMLQDGKL